MVIEKSGFVWVFLAMVCSCAFEKQVDTEVLFNTHCGRCHSIPDPKELPKFLWKEKVLPEMGARLGIQSEYNPYLGLSWEERFELDRLGVYPSKSQISALDWEKIRTYILDNAPDSLPSEADRASRNAPLTQFSPEPVNLDNVDGAFVTFLGFQDGGKAMYIGDVYGQLWLKPNGAEAKIISRTETPISNYTEQDNEKFVTEIGIMPPSQIKVGRLSGISGHRLNLIVDSLHRPVHTLISNLDKQGDSEIIISEFGNYTGQLSLITKDSTCRYSKRTILNFPGVIKVVVADMNRDGRDDLVVLASQGEEGVYILFQDSDLAFNPRQVIRFSPVYGSNWMEVADYDSDGYLDIITAHGDNADYSFGAKPFHGVRIYINDGSNRFTEKFFYPVYGATRVIAADFDQDKDLDLAVSAFFPDYATSPEESFIYLENRDLLKYEFKAFTFPQSVKGRWLVMEKGDYDQDGDEDLVLGSFAFEVVPTPSQYLDDWKGNSVDLIVLKNQLKD